GRVGAPHVELRAGRRGRRVRQHAGLLREARDVEHVHAGREELVLGLRGVGCLGRGAHASPWMALSCWRAHGTLVPAAITYRSEAALGVLIQGWGAAVTGARARQTETPCPRVRGGVYR